MRLYCEATCGHWLDVATWSAFTVGDSSSWMSGRNATGVSCSSETGSETHAPSVLHQHRIITPANHHDEVHALQPAHGNPRCACRRSSAHCTLPAPCVPAHVVPDTSRSIDRVYSARVYREHVYGPMRELQCCPTGHTGRSTLTHNRAPQHSRDGASKPLSAGARCSHSSVQRFESSRIIPDAAGEATQRPSLQRRVATGRQPPPSPIAASPHPLRPRPSNQTRWTRRQP